MSAPSANCVDRVQRFRDLTKASNAEAYFNSTQYPGHYWFVPLHASTVPENLIKPVCKKSISEVDVEESLFVYAGNENENVIANFHYTHVYPQIKNRGGWDYLGQPIGAGIYFQNGANVTLDAPYIWFDDDNKDNKQLTAYQVPMLAITCFEYNAKGNGYLTMKNGHLTFMGNDPCSALTFENMTMMDRFAPYTFETLGANYNTWRNFVLPNQDPWRTYSVKESNVLNGAISFTINLIGLRVSTPENPLLWVGTGAQEPTVHFNVHNYNHGDFRHFLAPMASSKNTQKDAAATASVFKKATVTFLYCDSQAPKDADLKKWFEPSSHSGSIETKPDTPENCQLFEKEKEALKGLKMPQKKKQTTGGKPNKTGPKPPPKGSSPGGLSTGAMVGIAVVAVVLVGGLIAGVVAALVVRKRRQRTQRQAVPAVVPEAAQRSVDKPVATAFGEDASSDAAASAPSNTRSRNRMSSRRASRAVSNTRSTSTHRRASMQRRRR